MPRKRVVFLPRWYPNRYDPMPGLFIRRHAISVKPWYDVSVLYVHLNTGPQNPLYELSVSEEYGILEVTVYVRSCQSGIGKLDSLMNLIRFFLAHLKGFRRIKRLAGKPDIIHVNVLTRCGVVAWLYRMSYRVPYVITEHWTRYLSGMENYRGFLRKAITRLVVKYAEAVLPVTKNLQKAMESHGLNNRNYQVIPNVVDTSLFRPLPNHVQEDVKTILHVSCFDDNQKNITGILRVLKRLSEQRCDWKCIMVGEGMHYDRIVEYTGELGLKGRFVEFTGLKENQELVEIMQQASFQLMFSRYENLPVVIPESFACGVPFLSSRVGGIDEHILAPLGRLVASEDEDGLLEALHYLLDNLHLFNQSVIRQYALDHFSKEVIGRQIADVYDDAVRKY